jgi:L-ascorbate metabolism protein UlaG (beta-lactamase superfamily)
MVYYIHTIRGYMMQVKVEYIHHSGYVVETDDAVLMFDVVEGYLPRKYLATEKNVVFFVSHSHSGHYYPGIFNYHKQVVVSEDVLIPVGHKAIVVKPNDSLIVSGLKIKVFASTELGVSYYAQTKDVAIFHAGDFNFWHWKSETSEEEVELSRLMFLNIIEDLKGLPVDIAMFPVVPRMGKQYDEGARIYIESIKPTWFFPMHYKKAEDLKSLKNYLDKKHVSYHIPSEINQTFEIEVNK